ncbi:MAG TPA: hypothetical protein VMW19_07745 [Myxococcota bacterium]|nr:hypothetical protein [Myxococcota bacterium]
MRRLASRIAPLAAIVAVYLPLRSTVLASDLGPGYGLALSGRLPAIAALQLSMAFGGGVHALLVSGLALALLGIARTRVAIPGRALLGLGVWSLLALLPFSLLAMPRVPVPIALPVALALGTIADRFWMAWGERRALASAVAIGALAIALFPADRLAERARNPRGAIGRELHGIIRQHVVDDRTTTFVVLTGRPSSAANRR